jgi:hypothetical protein
MKYYQLLIYFMVSIFSAIAYGNQNLEQIAQKSASEVYVNHEVEMITYRRKLMGKPGLQLYVVFFSSKGQPVDYFVTDGKCSSSTKRLLPTWKKQTGQTGIDSDGYFVHGDFIVPARSLDGTSGSSDKYIFCKTVDGKYKQWNRGYYISDAPIELTIKPLVVNIKSP